VNIDADGLIWATAILPARPAFARLARPPKRHYTFARRLPGRVTKVGSGTVPTSLQGIDLASVFVFESKAIR
jgi:hypothetical protein